MADPLSGTASVLAVATAAIVSVRSLCDTVKSFQNRDKTLRRLQAKLSGLLTILESLAQVVDNDTSILPLLESPIERCKEICKEFEQSMKKFNGKSKTKLAGLDEVGIHARRDSKISREVLQKYEEMIKETAYNLELHLQKIDGKLASLDVPNTTSLGASIDLQDERAVTLQCLRICEDANSYIESLAVRESNLLKAVPQLDAGRSTQEDFAAQTLVRQAFSSSQASLADVIKSLGERLQSVLQSGEGNKTERSRLQEDITVSQQCLQVCKVAREISHQKIHTVGEAVAEEDSDQIVVTTLADLFDVKKALSRGRSAQLVATLTPENFDHVVDKRYASRFAVPADGTSPFQTEDTPSVAISQTRQQSILRENGADGSALGQGTRRDRPNPNEMRRRQGDGGSGR